MHTCTCQACGKPFNAIRSNVKFCSDRCRKANYNSKRRTSFDPITCPRCGKSFIPRSKSQKFCSRDCQYYYNEEHRKQLRKNNRSQAVCPICGKSFTPFHNQKYCSQECKFEAQKKNVAKYRTKKFNLTSYTKICPFCGKEFTTKFKCKIYCSNPCQKQAVSERRKQERRQLSAEKKAERSTSRKPFYRGSAKCKNCGKAFRRSEYGSNPFCSGACERAYYKKCSAELSRKSREARKLGMTYGQYVAYLESNSVSSN
ncbi:MAG: hypothetical protein IJ728_06640 [Selenomonadaceae bacterium]|nr:hypothetical protein [Selenomonadaceae bacterium]